jgi:hypothetical protein
MSVIACLQQLRIAQPDDWTTVSGEWTTPLLELLVLGLGFLQDGDVGFLGLGQFHFKRIYLVATHIADEESRTVGS